MYGIKSFFKISEAQLAFLQAEQSFERVKQKKLQDRGGGALREEQRGGEEEAGGVRRRGEYGVQLLRGIES